MSGNTCLFQSCKRSNKVSENHIYPLKFKTYPKNAKLCVVDHLKKYIELTQNLGSSDKLAISYKNLSSL